MTVQKDTEAPPDAGQWLDHLDDATALAVMLDDQAEATTAIRQSLGQIERAAAAITKRMAEELTKYLHFMKPNLFYIKSKIIFLI